ncbi:Hypothetical protein (plasmid) [Pseudomonas putida]|nr:Hypothetical protein [Pseudomonas putida]
MARKWLNLTMKQPEDMQSIFNALKGVAQCESDRFCLVAHFISSTQKRPSVA